MTKHTTTWKLWSDLQIAAAHLEYLPTGPAMEMMMVFFAGDLVSRCFCRKFEHDEELLRRHRCDISVERPKAHVLNLPFAPSPEFSSWEFFMKKIAYFTFGIVVGVVLCLVANGLPMFNSIVPAGSKQPELTVRLHRFRLQADKLTEFDRWIRFEHEHHEETLETLEREKMYAEVIFRDPFADPATIYWLEIRGPKGESVSTSPLPIDREYELFMSDTLVPHSGITMNPEYVLVPRFISNAIAQHEKK